MRISVPSPDDVQESHPHVSTCSLQVAVLQETGLYSCHAGTGIPQQLELVLRRAWQVKRLADVLWDKVTPLLGCCVSEKQCLEAFARAVNVPSQSPSQYCAFTVFPVVVLAGATWRHTSGRRAISILQHVCLQDRWRLAKQLGPLAAIPASFAVFVAANGGVVIGDRLMHAPVWHLCQLLYFLLFAAAALAPATLSPDRCALVANVMRASQASHDAYMKPRVSMHHFVLSAAAVLLPFLQGQMHLCWTCYLNLIG